MLTGECRQSRIGRLSALNLGAQHLLQQVLRVMASGIHHRHMRVVPELSQN